VIEPIRPNIGLWISSEPSPESVQLGALRLCRVAWHSKNWQKLHWLTVFHISIQGSWSFVLGAKPTKAPPWRQDWISLNMT